MEIGTRQAARGNLRMVAQLSPRGMRHLLHACVLNRTQINYKHTALSRSVYQRKIKLTELHLFWSIQNKILEKSLKR